MGDEGIEWEAGWCRFDVAYSHQHHGANLALRVRVSAHCEYDRRRQRHVTIRHVSVVSRDRHKTCHMTPIHRDHSIKRVQGMTNNIRITQQTYCTPVLRRVPPRASNPLRLRTGLWVLGHGAGRTRGRGRETSSHRRDCGARHLASESEDNVRCPSPSQQCSRYVSHFSLSILYYSEAQSSASQRAATSASCEGPTLRRFLELGTLLPFEGGAVSCDVPIEAAIRAIPRA